MQLTYYSPKVLSQIFDKPKRQIWKMIRGGEFNPVLKIRNQYRVPQQSVEEFVKRNMISK